MARGRGTDGTQRLSAPGWGDRRLWIGLLLLAVSALLGAWLLRPADDAVLVLRAARDLSVGSPVLDAEPVQVSASLAGGYLSPAQASDAVLRLPVAAGDLIPLSALADPSGQSGRRVTVPVDPMHAPVDIQVGDRVDVWATASDASTLDAAAAPELVLEDVPVAAVAADEVGMSGQFAVVLDVPDAAVSAVVAAARGSVIDLVAVPITSQQAPS